MTKPLIPIPCTLNHFTNWSFPKVSLELSADSHAWCSARRLQLNYTITVAKFRRKMSRKWIKAEVSLGWCAVRFTELHWTEKSSISKLDDQQSVQWGIVKKGQTEWISNDTWSDGDAIHSAKRIQRSQRWPSQHTIRWVSLKFRRKSECKMKKLMWIIMSPVRIARRKSLSVVHHLRDVDSFFKVEEPSSGKEQLSVVVSICVFGFLSFQYFHLRKAQPKRSVSVWCAENDRTNSSLRLWNLIETQARDWLWKATKTSTQTTCSNR